MRGCATQDGESSGACEMDATAPNGLATSAHSITPNPHDHTFPIGATDGANYIDQASNNAGDKTTQATSLSIAAHTISGDAETRPYNMYVVWIMRVK